MFKTMLGAGVAGVAVTLALPVSISAGDLEPPSGPAATMLTLEEVAAHAISAEEAAAGAASNAAAAENAATGAAAQASGAQSAAQAAETAANTAAANASSAQSSAQSAESAANAAASAASAAEAAASTAAAHALSAEQAAIAALEGRIPLMIDPNASPGLTIDQPGSYVLTQNVRLNFNGAGIVVSAPEVTIDLNGHTIAGVGAGSGAWGIRIQDDAHQATIHGGTLADFGAGGVRASGDRTWVRDIRTAGGNAGAGIWIQGDGSLVERCMLTDDGGVSPGISLSGAHGVVRDCVVSNHGTGFLISGDRCQVLNSTGVSNEVWGFRVDTTAEDTVLTGNTAIGNSLVGISNGGMNSLITGNVATGNGTDFLNVTGAASHTTTPEAGVNLAP